MSAEQAVQEQYAELNAKYLPPEAGTCRLQLLHHVRGLFILKDVFGGFTSQGLQRVERPANFEHMSHGEQDVIFNEDDRLRFRRTVDDVIWLRSRLPELFEQVGLPADCGMIEDVEVGSPAMLDIIDRGDNWYSFANRADKVFGNSLKQLERILLNSILGSELPERWEPSEHGEYPLVPVRTVRELKKHLQYWLSVLNQAKDQSHEWFDALARELRNARRVVDQFIEWPAGSLQVADTPKTIHDAEREMERLIKLLTPADEVPISSRLDGEVEEKSLATNPSDQLLLNDTCLGIMDVLIGRSMTVEMLAKEVVGGDSNRLYRDGLKKVLEANGLVKHDRKLGGWFRPDKPPLKRSANLVKSRANK